MRNLKKVLSMTLALVMMLGMMTFAGAAETTKITSKDMTDMATVVNKEAVSLLIDLGIINGIKQADGTYKYAPKDSINRASYAKMVYAVMMASNNADVYKGVNTGLNDVADHWAEGFIGYCVTTKLAVGNGKGAFMPDANITTVTAAKMLLVALGYDAKASGYEGDLWSINIMRDAQKAGLLNNVDQKAGETLTRDNAAQLIYNALFSKTVVPDFQYDMGIKYLKKYDYNATTLGQEVFNLAKVVATVDTITNLGVVTLTPVPQGELLAAYETAGANAAALSSSGYKFTPEMVGTNIAFYTKNKVAVSAGVVTLTYDSLISSTISASSSTVLYTTAGGIATLLDVINKAHKDFKVALELGTPITEYAVSTLVNGASSTNADNTAATFALEAGAGKAADLVKLKGVIVDFVDTNANGKADIIKITNKTMDTLTADPSTKVVGDDTQVKVPGVTGLANYSTALTTETVVGYEGLKKGDVVLSVKIGTTYFLEKAVVLEGKMAAKSGTTIKIDGAFYGDSSLGNYAVADFTDYTNTYKFYLDNGKNIMKAEKVTDNATGENAVVIARGWVGTGTEIDGNSYAQAKLLKMDGSTEVVKVTKFNGNDVTFAGATAYTNITADKFYTYEVDAKGNYELKTNSDVTAIANNKVVNSQKKFDDTNLADNNTVFLVKVTDADSNVTYKTYKGIDAVPSMSTTVTGDMLKKNTVATFVYAMVGAANITGTDSDAVYFYIPDHTDFIEYPATATAGKYFEYTAYVDGVKSSVKIDATADIGTSDIVYKASAKVDDNVYTNATAAITVRTGITTAVGGTLVVDSESKVYSYDADTKVYIINDADKEVSVGSIDNLKADATDNIIVFADTNNMANIIFVRPLQSALKVFTGVDVYVNGTKATISGNATAGTISTIKKGDVVTLKLTGVSAEATYTVSAKTVPSNATSGSTLVFNDIVVVSESGVAAAAVTFTLTMTTVS